MKEGAFTFDLVDALLENLTDIIGLDAAILLNFLHSLRIHRMTLLEDRLQIPFSAVNSPSELSNKLKTLSMVRQFTLSQCDLIP